MKQINEQYAIHTGTSANGQVVTTLYKTHGKWASGELFELSEPSYIKAWYFEIESDLQDTPVTEAEILHEIELNDWTRWNTELTPGQKIEISECIYDDLLGCLPPHRYEKNYFEVGEPHHHTNKGEAIYRACWIEDGKFYTGYPKQTKTVAA